MSDRVRAVSIAPRSGRITVERDLEQQAGIFQRAAGTFKIGGGAPQLSQAEPNRPRVAPRQYGRTDPARACSGTWRVRGDSYSECIANAEALIASVDTGRVDRLIEWRPEGLPVSTLLRVTGPGTWTSDYRWHQFFGARSIDFDISWPIEPVGYGQPWDVWEEWSTDTGDDPAGMTQLVPNSNGGLHPQLNGIAGYTSSCTNGSTTSAFAGTDYANLGGPTFNGAASSANVAKDFGAGWRTALATAGAGAGTWTLLTPLWDAVGRAVGQYATFPVKAGQIIGARARAILAVTDPQLSGPIKLNLVAYDSSFAVVSRQQLAASDLNLTAYGVGVPIDIAGAAIVPAGATHAGLEITTALSGDGNGAAVDVGRFAAYRLKTLTQAIPAYSTGDDDDRRWTGQRYYSPTVQLFENKLTEWEIVSRAGLRAQGYRSLKVVPDTTGAWECLAVHRGRNTPPLLDDFAAFEFTTGASPTAGVVPGVLLSYVSAQQYLVAQLEPASPGMRIGIYYRNGANFTQVATSGISSVNANTRYWLTFVRHGNRLTYRLQRNTYPSEQSLAVIIGGSFNLNSDTSLFPRGVGGTAGFRVAGPVAVSASDWTFHSFVREPLSFEFVTDTFFEPLPQTYVIPPLPGDPDGPPALADVHLNPAATVQASQDGAWALFAWAARRRPEDMLTTGSFEIPTSAFGSITTTLGDWATTVLAASDVLAAGATKTLDAVGPNVEGDNRFKLTTTAINQGAWTTVWGPFVAGRTYTLMGYLAANAAAVGATIGIGRPDNGDKKSQASAVAPQGAPGLYFVQWTPQVDYSFAQVWIARLGGAGTVEVYADALQVFDGVDIGQAPPTRGHGGRSPFGRFPAASAPFAQTDGDWVAGTTAGSLKLDIPSSGASGSRIAFWLDPNSILPPEGEDHLELEVYACYTISSPNVVKCWAALSSGSNAPLNAIGFSYAQPWGAAGRALKVGTGLNELFYSRIGSVSTKALGRSRQMLNLWFMNVGAAPATANRFQLRYIAIVPMGQRAALPTGKRNLQAIYPRPWFDGQTGAAAYQSRVYNSDLSSRVLTLDSRREMQSSSIGGEAIELPVGRDLLFLPWATMGDGGVPDDPGSTAAGADLSLGRFHLAITPRYGLAAPDQR